MKVLFLQAPSFDGFDGGAGSRYQARREICSFWYPTWLAQAAAMVPDSKLIDAPPHGIGLEEVIREIDQIRHRDLPYLDAVFSRGCVGRRSAESGEAGAENRADRRKGCGRPGRQPEGVRAIDFVARKEYDFTVKELAEGRDWDKIQGLSYRNASGAIVHNEDRADPRKHGSRCPSSRRSTSATSTSRNTSSAI